MEMALQHDPVAPDRESFYLRPMRAGDAPALRALFESLTPDDRRRRFHGAVGGLSSAWLDQLASTDQCRHVALAVTTSALPAATLVAEARWAMDESGIAAEVALTVAPAWRRRGVGAWCLRALVRSAASHGVRSLRAAVLDDNAPMLALLKQCGFVRRASGGEPGVVIVEAGTGA